VVTSGARDLARCIEHTLLRPEATAAEVEALCAAARGHGFHAVCVAGSRVLQAVDLLEGTDVRVVAVAGFPLGNGDTDSKRMEVEGAIDNGAHEIEVVLNLGRLKDGDDALVVRELHDLVEAADERVVKVILEVGLLAREEAVRGCELVLETGARFVSTGTGWGPRGVAVEDVKLLRERVGPKFGVKAAGGIRDATTAWALLEAGADRIGSSDGVALVRGPTPACGS